MCRSSNAGHRIAIAAALAVLVASPALRSQAPRRPPLRSRRPRRVREVDYRAAECDGGRHRHVARARRAVPGAHRRLRSARARLNAMIALNPQALDEAAALDAERRAGRSAGRCTAFRSSSRTTTPRRTCRRPADRWRSPGFADRPRRVHGAEAARRRRGHHRQDQPARARLRHHHRSARSAGRRATRTTRRATRADRAAAPAPRSPRASPPPAWAPTRAARSASRRRNNNLFGLRGTLGLSSRDGIMPLSHTQDIGGPLARTVTDLRSDARRHGRLRPGRPDDRAAATATFRAAYRRARRRRWLGDVRIGVLTPLFGTAPEDEEVGAHRPQGARRRCAHIGRRDRRDRHSRASTSCCRARASSTPSSSSTCSTSWRSSRPAPVHSLGEILDERQVSPRRSTACCSAPTR